MDDSVRRTSGDSRRQLFLLNTEKNVALQSCIKVAFCRRGLFARAAIKLIKLFLQFFKIFIIILFIAHKLREP